MILLGVHTPETESERDTGNLTRFVKKNNITYPILVDTDGKNWNRWGQQFWPTVYLIDKGGIVRYRWEGELEYGNAGGEKKMAAKIRELLAEK